MNIELIDCLRASSGLAVGGAIGWAFGLLQDLAHRRHAEQERTGRLKSIWSLMPGSGVRVAYLLLGLVLVQLVCPLLFAGGIQWAVSAGVVLGYGWTLLRRFRLKLKGENT